MRKADWAALYEVRGAIHGWAFVHRSALPAHIRMAEDAIRRLPDRLKPEGERLVEPLRRYV